MTHKELAKLLDGVPHDQSVEAIIRLSAAFGDADNDKDGIKRAIFALEKMTRIRKEHRN